MKEIHDMCELENTSIFPIGDENSAFAQHFDGKSYLNMISTQQVVIGNVTFEAGCRNHWHIHHAKKGGGQILLASSGRCCKYFGRGEALAWGSPRFGISASGSRGSGRRNLDGVVRSSR